MRRIAIALLLLVLLLSGCGGVSKEDYDAVCTERDALRTELQETQTELQELRDTPDRMTVKIKGDFIATVRALIPDYETDYETPRVAVVTLFQSTPFTVYTGAFTGQLEVGETYVFEIKEQAVEISLEEYEYSFPDPEVVFPQYNLCLSGFRLAEEGEGGLDSVHLEYEAYET